MSDKLKSIVLFALRQGGWRCLNFQALALKAEQIFRRSFVQPRTIYALQTEDKILILVVGNELCKSNGLANIFAALRIQQI